ncbi:MAG: NAD(P)H-binding protein [Pseudomonadota bacterium]
MNSPRQTICVLGATGTIGRAVVAELVRRGFDVLCLVRAPVTPAGARVALVDVSDSADLARALAGEQVEVVMSCMASRTGVPGDALAVDYQANLNVMHAARDAGVGHFILLSAICVQNPRLAFQHAKLKFEAALVASGMRYSIVRPTAFFKSLSGQVDRVRQGKPYLLFGDGERTACKPISDGDLAAYIVDCIAEGARWNAILPIGGPGPAITPREQGEALFSMMGREPRFRSVPTNLLLALATGLGAVGRLIPALGRKAELARIGHYYATESMLVMDPHSGRYDGGATPSTGSETLFDHYRSLVAGDSANDRGDHAAF